MTIADRIIEARKRRGFTQRDLAVALGISVQAVSVWETGKASPKNSRLDDIARALGVMKSYLQGDDKHSNVDMPYTNKNMYNTIPVFKLDTLHLHMFKSGFAPILSKLESYISSDIDRFGDQFAVRMDRSSSCPKFSDGDLLIFDTNVACQAGDIVVLFSANRNAHGTGSIHVKFDIVELSTETLARLEGSQQSGKENFVEAVLAVMMEHRSFRRVPAIQISKKMDQEKSRKP